MSSMMLDGNSQKRNISSIAKNSQSKFMNQDNPSVKSVEISSDRDVQREMENISKTLSNSDADWKLRRDALIRLQGITIGGACDYDNFYPLLVKLKGPLNTQLQDLRSAIPREACAALNLIAAILLERFDSFAEYFIPTLFKLIVNSVHFISDAGNNCIRTILQSISSRADRILPEIFKQTRSTHNTLRSRCAEYILLILSEYSTSALDKFSDQIVSIVESGLSDAIPDVRSVSRQSFKALSNHWQDLSQSLLSRLDSSVQKYLYDDHNNKKEDKAIKQITSKSSENLPKPLRSKTTASKPSDSMKENIPSKNVVPPSPALMHTFPAGPQITRSNSVGIPNSSSFPISIRVPVATNSDVSIAPSRSVITPSLPSVPSAPTHSYSRVEIIPQTEESTVVIKHLPKSKPHRVAIEEKPLSLPLSGGNNSIINSSSSSSSIPSIPIPTLSTLSTSVPSAQRTIIPPVVNVQRPSSASLPSKPSLIHEDKQTSSHHSFVSLTTALTKANSSLWSTRVEGFQNIKQNLTSRPNEVMNHIDKLLNCVIQHSNDAHYRVVQLALESIRIIISNYHSSVEGGSNLEKILSCLLSKATDRKETVRQDAMHTIDRFMDKFGNDAIVTLLKAMDQHNVKFKSKCIEILTTIIPTASSFFRHGVQMKLAIQRIIPLANASERASALGAQSIQQLKQPSLNLLMLLYFHYKEVFFTQILLLPIDLQLDARNALASSIPDVDQQLHFFSHSPPPSLQSVQTTSSSSQPESIEDYQQEEPVEQSNISLLSDKSLQESEVICESEEPKQEQSVDESDWIQSITILNSRDSLLKIIKYSSEKDTLNWSRHFHIMLSHVMKLSKDTEANVRELSMIALKEIISNQSKTLVFASLAPILMCFLDGSLDLKREVSLAAEEGIQQLLSTADTQMCIQVLEPILKDNSENTDNLSLLKNAVKLTSMCIKKMSANSLSSEVPNLIPSLFECLKSGNADVRKTVVFCLVDIYTAIGDEFEPYLGMLSSTQAKLIQIYCKRKKV